MIPIKTLVLSRLYEEVVFGIVRTRSEESAYRVASTLIESGMTIQEVSLTTPGALSAIQRLRQSHGKEALIGAGTVMDAASARLAIDSGSAFLVCPNLSEDVIRTGNRYGIPVLPGIGTVTELVTAMEMGADLVKMFPASVLGPDFIKAVQGPLPQARIIPVSGVDSTNLEIWMESGAYALGIGQGLAHPEGPCEDVERIRKQTEELLAKVREVKKKREMTTNER